MPPQTPRFEKSVRTPRVAHERALDLSQEAKAAADMAMDFGKTVSNGIASIGAGFAQYKKDKQNADDLMQANNAYNEYMKQMGDLNAQMQTMKGADAVDFQPKYDKTADALHSNVVQIMDNEISNPKVREELRSRINAFNTRNRDQSFLYFDKERRDLQQRANAESIDTLANQAVTEFQNGGIDNNAKLDNLFSQVNSKIQAGLEAQGYHPLQSDQPGAAEINEGIAATYRNQVMQKRQEILTAIGDHLNATNTGDTRPWKETASAIALMEYARDNGYVEENWANKKLAEYEEKALGVELIRNKDKYWNPTTGEYNYDAVAKNVKYLSQDQIIRADKIVADATANNPTASAELGGFVVGLNNAAIDDDKRWRRLHGFLTQDELNDLTYGMDEDQKKEMEARVQSYMQKTSPSEIIEHYIAMKEIQKKPVIYVPELNRAVRVTKDGKVDEQGLTPEVVRQIEANLAAGNYPVYYPWNRNSEYNNAIIQYQRMADAALMNKALEGDKRVVRKTGWWIFGGYKYRTQDVIYQNLWNAFSEEARRSAEQGDLFQAIDTMSLTQAADEAINAARKGGWVFADQSYSNGVRRDENGQEILDQNGKPQYIRSFGPIDLQISFDGQDKTQKAALNAVIISALRNSVGADRFGWLENTQLMKDAKKAAQQDKIGMVRGTGNTFVDDTDTFVRNYQASAAARFGMDQAAVMNTDAYRLNPNL